MCTYVSQWQRRGGLMVSVLDFGSGGPGSSPGWGHCVVFLGKTLYFHSTSLHPGVQMGTSKCAGGNPAMDQHPIQGGVAILRRFMLRKLELSTGPMGHLDPYQRLFFFVSQCLHLNCDCRRHGTKNICTFSTAATMHEVLNSTLNNNILEPIKFPSQFN